MVEEMIVLEKEGERLMCRVLYRPRKTAAIHIKLGGVIELRVPKGTASVECQSMLESKKEWIFKKVREETKQVMQNKTPSYEDGSALQFLGEKLILKKMVIVDGQIPYAVSKEGVLLVYVHSKATKGVLKNVIEKWYMTEAIKIFKDRVAHFQHYFEVKPSRIIVKYQKSRYGSCNIKRELRFNFKCVELPLEVIDYLVVHEMAHMVHMNHSKTYWDLVRSILPHADKQRRQLKNFSLAE